MSSVTPTREDIARQRLCAQKEESKKAMREAGEEAGREFVLNTSENGYEYQSMSALNRLWEDHGADGLPDDLPGLIDVMDPSDHGLSEWFLDKYGRDTEQPGWVSGFISGALGKFRELAP